MVADRSLSLAALSIEWYAWLVNLPLRERWALVSQAAEISESTKPPLKHEKEKISERVEDKEDFGVNPR